LGKTDVDITHHKTAWRLGYYQCLTRLVNRICHLDTPQRIELTIRFCPPPNQQELSLVGQQVLTNVPRMPQGQ
jgi:hypothetical protein